jgi:hypothetical protein
LVRLLWIAAAVVTGGLAVPAYILLWIILPRDDRPPVAGATPSWYAPEPTEPPPVGEAASHQERVQEQWWQSERYVERSRNHRHHPRSTGIILVALGVLLLAANAGAFSWIQWRMMWPIIFIGLGVLLLIRRAGGWGR